MRILNDNDRFPVSRMESLVILDNLIICLKSFVIRNYIAPAKGV